MAMQKDSVSEQLRKMWPLQSTSRTPECCTAPSSSTRSCSWWRSRISSSRSRFGPSPPMMKRTAGYSRQMRGMTSTTRSIPLRYTSRLIITMLIVPCGHTSPGSGVKRVGSTALGIAEVRLGGSAALSTKFSRQVWDTQMQWSTSAMLYLHILLTHTDARSAKPNREWSVYTHGRPIVRAYSRHSWPVVDVAWCACTTVMRSRSRISRNSGRKE
mmetsp:Transcript_13229/g.50669  ORF Transcript_13229/g.50669 Transcript_13229/m.50669 type:complete len:214 (-) Transcript_13229:647-1288(-)